ncbi:MAG TPA: hypothetical protein VMV66_01605 [Candidatus Humimicrobiaceae bacterium]|nr:hypothetical protein [Candidatus Humimicrobiaceae bacterium]
MRNKWLLSFLIFTIGSGLVSVVFFNLNSAQASGVYVIAYISVCGDGIAHGAEVCDGNDLKGQACQDFGFSEGTLACNLTCDAFDTSACYTPPSPPPGGGGGVAPSAETRVNFSGRAYPKSAVTLLKNAQIAATTVAGADSNFQISLAGLSGGNYIFSVCSEDRTGNRSSLLTFPVSVTAGVTTNVSGIFIAPTIAVDKSEVKRGDNIAIFGQSAPQSEITITINSDEEFFTKTDADKDGIYLYNFDTTPLAMEQHFTKSKAALNGEISSFGKTVSFFVGTKTVFAKPSGECTGKADLNSDCRVNLVDFSIAAYWYKRSISSEFKVIDQDKLNGDGKIDLVDFSIMAYYWTG